ncbi:MAG: hypothetical protein RLZZ175_3139 [Bacteroidota bacterium]|jgi:predicted ATPase
MAEKVSNSKKGFRVLAIKTFKNFEINDKPFLKVLKEDTIYPFYHCYSYSNNDFEKIVYHPEKDIDLYSLPNFKINISAVVGENGSGKSSIIDLLLLSLYNLGAYSKVLNKKRIPDLNFPDVREEFHVEKIESELLFEYNGKLCSYFFNEDKVLKFKFSNSNFDYIKNEDPEKEDKDEYGYIKNLIDDFFYSIVINYSHYSFNSNEVGAWLESLFHKNDGYQTPVVINPFREEGNIDINNEKDLLLDRLTANLLEDIGEKNDSDTLRNLGNNKIAKSIIFKINKRKLISFNVIQKSYNKNQEIPTKVIVKYDVFLDTPNHKLWFNTYFGINFDELNENKLIDGCLNYILFKASKIVKRYKPYNSIRFKSVLEGIWPESFFEILSNDHSHIVYKIKRAIYFIKYYREWTDLAVKSTNFEYSLVELTKVIRDIKSKDSTLQTIEILPPAFFDKEIVLENNLLLNSLSSGEKQKIFSISSIAYHLINLNSVNSIIYKKYNYVNLVLDEIELYYHPDWQRKFIFELRDYLSKINPQYLDNIAGLNLLFLTHSPFILSDIPSNNVLKLFEGKIVKEEVKETFGANIHLQLRESFFMKGGLIGEFSKEKIHQLINDLKKEKIGDDMLDEKERIYSNKIINMIGEPLLKERLVELYRTKYESNEALLRERDRINALLEKRGL